MTKNSLLVVVALLACACGSKSSGGACVAPSGAWTIKMTSTDPACTAQTFTADFTKVDASDGCAITSQDFDTTTCAFTQQATCSGGVATTLAFTLDAAGRHLTGTTTVEADVDAGAGAGVSCTYDVTGSK